MTREREKPPLPSTPQARAKGPSSRSWLPSDTEAPRSLAPVAKPADVRRLGAVDVNALAGRVDRLSERVWDLEDRRKPNRHSCFHHTRHVILRFPLAGANPGGFRSAAGWRLWSALMLPPMRRAAAAYGFVRPVFPKVMLARLEAGHGIDAHVDEGRLDSLVHKVHIPLRTDARAVLTVDGERFHLAAGYAWEVNNLAPHGAHNGGARDRIHLIFEVFEGAGQVDGDGDRT